MFVLVTEETKAILLYHQLKMPISQFSFQINFFQENKNHKFKKSFYISSTPLEVKRK